jgi:hypothetical protein
MQHRNLVRVPLVGLKHFIPPISAFACLGVNPHTIKANLIPESAPADSRFHLANVFLEGSHLQEVLKAFAYVVVLIPFAELELLIFS